MTVNDQYLARLAARVGRQLFRDSRTVALAESCTGGYVCKVLTDIAGSSAWFPEGFVVYSNSAKVRQLGVSIAVLRRHGAVSEATARAMAEGALKRAGSHLAVAITGIAGPGGAVPGKPVGTVYLAWAERRGRSMRVWAERNEFRGDRDAVRRQAVRAALRGLLR